MKQETITISPDEEKTRIDSLLAKRFPESSRSYIQYLIDEGFVTYNQAGLKKRDKLDAGSKVSISFAPTKPSTLTPEPLDLDIVYEDDHILAINKKKGIVVHPGAGNYTGTLIAGVLHYLGSLPESEDPLRPGVVHRLDKETSGIILIAKTSKAHAKLVDAFKNREIKKTYQALTYGIPKVERIEGPIGRHPVKREMMTIRPTDGKDAVTEIEIVSEGTRYSHIIARPITGRTHQIRVHLKSIHTPIVGDKIYANPQPGEQDLCLAATEISFAHPITGKTLTLKAPLPRHIEQKLNSLDK